MMTKVTQCETCIYDNCTSCSTCRLYSDAYLKPASHVEDKHTCAGYVHCKCLTVELDEHCPYYKEV